MAVVVGSQDGVLEQVIEVAGVEVASDEGGAFDDALEEGNRRGESDCFGVVSFLVPLAKCRSPAFA